MKKEIVLALLCVFLLNCVYSECSEGQVNINTADTIELDKIIYVGPATATKIISSRPFSSLDDLLNVSGIGETKLTAIKSEGIACVSGSSTETNKEEPEKETEDKEENNKNEKNDEEKIISNIQTPIKEQEIVPLKAIVLNPQVIKTIENENKLSKDNYAFYGLVVFSILLAFLYAIKYLRRDKNEFE